MLLVVESDSSSRILGERTDLLPLVTMHIFAHHLLIGVLTKALLPDWDDLHGGREVAFLLVKSGGAPLFLT
jgi:hypothetical protein